MEKKLTVLYLVSENTTTSIPLELAIHMSSSPKINLYIVTYYGAAADEPLSLAKNVTDLNIPKANIKKGFNEVNKLIKELRPDIVHVHHNMSAFISILAAKYNKIKLIIKTEHNDHRFLKWHQKVLNIPILFFSNKVICNSFSTKKSFYLWEKLFADKKTIPIYNGININRILKFSGKENSLQIREKYNVASNERLFFCAARLIKQKNFKNLIKAFSLATYENKNIRLLIAGTGNLYKELLELKNQIDKFNKIQLLGILPREEVFKLMNASDFFIIVSLWEGFCNAAVEAMIARCPIICSDIITLREVIGNETGYFVNPNSSDDILHAILKFASMHEYSRAELAEKNFKKATQLYNIENTSQQYIDQYLKGEKRGNVWREK
jgi:glycosyltransferase involved in cell wall biosynthesis